MYIGSAQRSHSCLCARPNQIRACSGTISGRCNVFAVASKCGVEVRHEEETHHAFMCNDTMPRRTRRVEMWSSSLTFGLEGLGA